MPSIHPAAAIAATAVLRGEVEVGAGAVIRDGAVLVADGGKVRIGENTIVMEHAVIRSTAADDCKLGAHVMVGPHVHLTGCTVEDEVPSLPLRIAVHQRCSRAAFGRALAVQEYGGPRFAAPS